MTALSSRPAGYSAARQAWRAVGTLSSPARMLPSFLIVGGQRCGTTSLFDALMQHPDVRKPFGRKGIHYFDVGYRHNLAWYRGHFPLAVPASRAITGESSPYYMFHPLAAGRIARDLPEVRLIVALRDPVERAYSAHAHELARGFETEPFERALELEPERLAGAEEQLSSDSLHDEIHAHRHQAYLTRGQYVDQLLRMEALVGRERMHVVDSAEFFSEPQAVFARLSAFLRLAGCDQISFGKHNARPRSPMPDSLRRTLRDHFAPYDNRLAEWLGRTPSWRA